MPLILWLIQSPFISVQAPRDGFRIVCSSAEQSPMIIWGKGVCLQCLNDSNKIFFASAHRWKCHSMSRWWTVVEEPEWFANYPLGMWNTRYHWKLTIHLQTVLVIHPSVKRLLIPPPYQDSVMFCTMKGLAMQQGPLSNDGWVTLPMECDTNTSYIRYWK